MMTDRHAGSDADLESQNAVAPAAVRRRDALRRGALVAATGAGAMAGVATAVPGPASAAGPVSATSSGPTPAVSASNPNGPTLRLSPSTADFLTTPGYVVGDFVNTGSALWQCVYAQEGVTYWTSTAINELVLLRRPFRVYASNSDSTFGNAKIAVGQTRYVDVSQRGDGVPSGVPATANAVAAQVQISATEGANGFLSIAAANENLDGFSTTVWNATGAASVTSFISALPDPENVRYSQVGVKCNGPAGVRTHFFLDVVGYYESYFRVGFADISPSPERVAAAQRTAERIRRDGRHSAPPEEK